MPRTPATRPTYKSDQQQQPREPLHETCLLEEKTADLPGNWTATDKDARVQDSCGTKPQAIQKRSLEPNGSPERRNAP